MGIARVCYALHVEGRQNNIKVTAVISAGIRTPTLLERFPDINVDILQNPRMSPRLSGLSVNLPLNQ
jgi:hypothetical protein